jgi:hypothetical protein
MVILKEEGGVLGVGFPFLNLETEPIGGDESKTSGDESKDKVEQLGEQKKEIDRLLREATLEVEKVKSDR